jgi:chromate reductase
VEQLQAIFGYRNAFIYPERVFVTRVAEALDELGRLTHTETAARLKSQAIGFVEFVETLQGIHLRPGK